MPVKHPSCAVYVRLRPADYLRIHAAALALEITPERFIRALVVDALEYYDRDNPGEMFRGEAFLKKRADGAYLRLVYLRLRKRHGADEAQRIILEHGDDPEFYAKVLKRKKRHDAGIPRVADIPTELMDEYRGLRLKVGVIAAKRMIGEEVRRKAGAK